MMAHHDFLTVWKRGPHTPILKPVKAQYAELHIHVLERHKHPFSALASRVSRGVGLSACNVVSGAGRGPQLLNALPPWGFECNGHSAWAFARIAVEDKLSRSYLSPGQIAH